MFILSASDEHTRLKSYSATVRGTASVIKIEIEIECSDHDEFGWRLRALAEIEAEQKARKAAPPPKGGDA